MFWSAEEEVKLFRRMQQNGNTRHDRTMDRTCSFVVMGNKMQQARDSLGGYLWWDILFCRFLDRLLEVQHGWSVSRMSMSVPHSVPTAACIPSSSRFDRLALFQKEKENHLWAFVSSTTPPQLNTNPSIESARPKQESRIRRPSVLVSGPEWTWAVG
jgi:hypothetical protein